MTSQRKMRKENGSKLLPVKPEVTRMLSLTRLYVVFFSKIWNYDFPQIYKLYYSSSLRGICFSEEIFYVSHYLAHYSGGPFFLSRNQKRYLERNRTFVVISAASKAP